MIRVAIIGLGRWGKRLVGAFAACSDVALCCNQRHSAPHVWMNTYHPGIPVCFGAEQAFADASIDAVVIATPIAGHAALVQTALEAGKHVFVEKPMAMTVAECRSLAALARARNRRLFVGHTFLFDPGIEELWRRAQADPIRDLRLTWLKLGTFDEDLVWNLASHDVAIALHLIGGDPEQTVVLDRGGALTGTDFLAARMAFPGSRSAYVTIDRCAAVTQKILTAVTVSGAVLGWTRGTLSLLTADGERDDVFTGTDEPLQREVAAFVKGVETGEPMISDADFGGRVVRVLESLAQAA